MGNSIKLGLLKYKSQEQNLTVNFDNEGGFVSFEFNMMGLNMIFEHWVVDQKGKSGLVFLDEACRRYDLVIEMSKKLFSNEAIPLELMRELKAIDVDMLKLKSLELPLKGKSHFSVSFDESLLKEIRKLPPIADNYESYDQYRLDMDAFMDNTVLQRKRVERALQNVLVMKLEAPQKDSYYTYNDKIAIFSYLATHSI